ncbi:nudix hydrolase 3-like [Vicia villosa]|uniref:nudix hydrolase 3-like n=1 Tax=Vicia villosa TaxID=3911 RepID=UPI00273AE00F|nr:nudix hydrolase 3-like [Vicia villosa]
MAEESQIQHSHSQQQEHFDNKTGDKTGITKPSGQVHRDGDYHRAVHVWIFAESTQQLLLQRRATRKDSRPDLWDISSAGHISAGDSALVTARYFKYSIFISL